MYIALVVNTSTQGEANEPLKHAVIFLRSTENVNFATQL